MKIDLVLNQINHFNQIKATRELTGVTPLIKALDSVGGWPLASTSGSFDEKHYDWRESFPAMIAEFGYNPVFSMGVSPDANDTKVNRFNVNSI